MLVLGDGNVVQRRLQRGTIDQATAGEATGQAELDTAAATLNAELAGLSRAAGATQARQSSAPLAAHVGEVVAQMLEESDGGRDRGGLHRRASSTCSSSRSSRGGAKLRGVLEVLQRSDFLEQLVPVLSRRGGVTVIIGHENINDAMHEVSLVFAPYGDPDSALGLLGVLGPTRMPYPRAIPTVRYLSTLMNELITNHRTENHD